MFKKKDKLLDAPDLDLEDIKEDVVELDDRGMRKRPFRL